MVGDAANGNWPGRIWQHLDHVAVFHQGLALPARPTTLPPRSNVVNVIESNEGIVEGLGHFVTMRSDILEAIQSVASGSTTCRIGENPGADPARVIHDEELQAVPIVSITGFKIKAVVTQNAALIRIAVIEQVRIRK